MYKKTKVYVVCVCVVFVKTVCPNESRVNVSKGLAFGVEERMKGENEKLTVGFCWAHFAEIDLIFSQG